MIKQEIYKFLNDNQIQYDITDHSAVFNMEDLSKTTLPYPASIAKNLFVCDDKKQHYYLISIAYHKRLDLKTLRKANNTRPLSLASIEDLISILKLQPGSVTPLGLLNDDNLKAELFIDDYFLDEPGIIGCHPNDNTATVWLKTIDLIEIINKHGNKVYITKL